MKRHGFITNSSSTAFVAYGILHKSWQDEEDSYWMKLINHIHDVMLTEEEKKNLGDSWCIDDLDCVDVIDKYYQKRYGERHPESVKYHEYKGEVWTRADTPVSVASEDQYSEPYLLFFIKSIGVVSDNDLPTEFDPLKVPKDQADEALREFCDLTGIRYEEPRWYVIGCSM